MDETDKTNPIADMEGTEEPAIRRRAATTNGGPPQVWIAQGVAASAVMADRGRAVARPAFVRWLAGAGLGLVAATATRLARPRRASAHPSCPPEFVQVGCCCLSANVWPACPDACPSEQSRQWTCCHGGTLVACFECTFGDSCYEGPHLCSSAFDVGTGC